MRYQGVPKYYYLWFTKILLLVWRKKMFLRRENPTLRQWLDPDARDTSDFSFKSTLILGWKLSFHVNWTSTQIWFAIFLPDVKHNPILLSRSLDWSSKHSRAKGTTDPGIEYFKLIDCFKGKVHRKKHFISLHCPKNS